MITVHHLESSRSHRVLWCLEELGVDYQLRTYARDPQTMLAPPELKKVHPLGKSPVVEIDGTTFVESGAVLEALLERFDRHGQLAPPPRTPAHDRYRFWMHYAEGSVMPPLLLKLVFQRVRSAPLPFFLKPVARGIADKVDAAFTDPQIRTHFDFIDAELAKGSWLVGDTFSAADIQMSYPLEAGLGRIARSGERANIRRFVDSIRERPAYQRAVAKGGPVTAPG